MNNNYNIEEKSLNPDSNNNNNQQDLINSNEIIVYRDINRRQTNINRKMSTERSLYKKKIKRKLSQNRVNNFIKGEKLKMDNVIKNIDEKENNANNPTKREEISEENKESRNIINKITYEKVKFYFCFLCIRKFENIENTLIDEGMKLISEELDIRNLFTNMLRCQKMKEQYKLEDQLQMSDQCKNNILNIDRKIAEKKIFSS